MLRSKLYEHFRTKSNQLFTRRKSMQLRNASIGELVARASEGLHNNRLFQKVILILTMKKLAHSKCSGIPRLSNRLKTSRWWSLEARRSPQGNESGNQSNPRLRLKWLKNHKKWSQRQRWYLSSGKISANWDQWRSGDLIEKFEIILVWDLLYFPNKSCIKNTVWVLKN